MSNSSRTIKRASMRRVNPPKCPKRVDDAKPRIHLVRIRGRSWVCTCGWEASADDG